jgi:hypothetical protein
MCACGLAVGRENLFLRELRMSQRYSGSSIEAKDHGMSSFGSPKLPEIQNLLQSLDPPRRTRPNLVYLTTIGVKQFYNNLKYPNELPPRPLLDRYQVEKLIGSVELTPYSLVPHHLFCS